MWPKAFAQLIELAPHISRLLPMADRFFQSKTAAEDNTRQALESMAAGLRSDLAQVNAKAGQIAAAQVSLSGQIEALGTQVGNTAADARSARLAAESLEARITRVESRQSSTRLFFVIVLVMLALVLILQALLFVHSR